MTRNLNVATKHFEGLSTLYPVTEADIHLKSLNRWCQLEDEEDEQQQQQQQQQQQHQQRGGGIGRKEGEEEQKRQQN